LKRVYNRKPKEIIEEQKKLDSTSDESTSSTQSTLPIAVRKNRPSLSKKK
jgi:hypothetical protein